MKCIEARKKISILIDGELAGSASQELMAHLEHCNSCHTEYEELKALKTSFAQPERLTPPASLLVKIRARIDEEKEVRPVFWQQLIPVFNFNTVAAAMAFAIMLLIGNYLGSHVWKNLLDKTGTQTEMVSLLGDDTGDETVTTAYQNVFQG